MSVRKRSWTTAKGEAKSGWIVDYHDLKGVRRLKTFRLKKEADDFALTARTEVREGVHVADRETVTVKEAGNLWLKSCSAAGLERSTTDAYEQHLRLHVVPFLGTQKLNKLTVPLIRAFQEELRSKGRSAAMIKRVTVSLGSLLSDAQERGLLVRNAVHEMSKRKKSTTEKRHSARLVVGRDIPSQNDIRAILTAAEGRYRPFILTAIFTGMRASELRGLTWADVDFNRAHIHVRQRADKYHVIGMPKSDAGQRTIPLTPMVVKTLKEWKLACPKGELNLVFPNGEGNVEWHQNILKRGYWPTQIRAGVTVPTDKLDDEGNVIFAPKYTGLHALRHWFASWCINSKADGGLELSPKAVQSRMGHSNISITFDTYGHLFPAVDETENLRIAERALLGA